MARQDARGEKKPKQLLHGDITGVERRRGVLKQIVKERGARYQKNEDECSETEGTGKR